ncbi:MAG: UPF0182 family protein, partial [Deltaproteobacteria bacterium]|nr:UPF0182 family protein [Deltaproteobacteria bacterium]
LSKDKLVYGPMQIEARIDQQTEISRELSLWGQRGSRVIRGNLLAIPVGDSFIYVEPIYLEAKQEEAQTPPPGQSGGRKQQARQPVKEIARTAALPELKRVIVAIGNRVAMEETLDMALSQVLDAVVSHKKEAFPKMPETGKISDLGALALKYYNNAKDYLQKGDWGGYGRELEKLENILKQLSKTTGEDKAI